MSVVLWPALPGFLAPSTASAIHRFCRSLACRLLVTLLALGLGGPVRAADGAEATMKQLIGKVSSDLDTLHKAGRIGNRPELEQLIRTDVLPSIDKDRLTRRVFRQFWPQVEKAGRAADAQERVLQSLVRTYAVALSSYSGDTITLVQTQERGKGQVAKTRLRRPSGETIQIDFNLAENNGQWLINDMAVDGIVVSLTLFNAIKPVFEQQGLDAALNSLAEVDVNKSGNEQKANPGK